MPRKSAANAPKLATHGAECKCIIPIANHIANEMLSPEQPIEHAVRQETLDLASCYVCLTLTADSTQLANHSRRCCTMYVALEHTHRLFYIKPKRYSFQEHCEMQHHPKPATHWTTKMWMSVGPVWRGADTEVARRARVQLAQYVFSNVAHGANCLTSLKCIHARCAHQKQATLSRSWDDSPTYAAHRDRAATQMSYTTL